MSLLHKATAARLLAEGRRVPGTVVGIHVWVTGGGEDSSPELHEGWAVEGDGRLYGIHQDLEPKSHVRLGMPVELRVDGDRAVIVWGKDARAEDWKPLKVPPERGIRDDRDPYAKVVSVRGVWTPAAVEIGGSRERKAMFGLTKATDVVATARFDGGEQAVELRKHPAPFYATHLYAEGTTIPGWISGQRLIIDWQAAAEQQPGVGVPPSLLAPTTERLAFMDKLMEPKPVKSAPEPGERTRTKDGGISWDTFLEVSQALARENVDTTEAADAIAQRYGLAPGEWAGAQLVWLGKLKRNPARMFQYGQALNAAHQQRGAGGEGV